MCLLRNFFLRETKENVQGTNSDAKETGTQINGVDQKEERNIQPEKNEETRIQKNKERLPSGLLVEPRIEPTLFALVHAL